MQNIRMDKGELLGIVRQNMEKHVREFKEAQEDYKVAMVNLAKSNLKLAEDGDISRFKKNWLHMLSEPTSYEKTYIRAERMLELSIDTTIELDESTFNQLVLDEWQWKDSFTASNISYKSYK